MNLHPGTYYGALISAELGEIGQNNTPAMILSFDLSHLGDPAGWQEITKERIEVLFWLTEKSKDFAFADLRALGFNGDFDAPRFGDDLYAGTELLMETESYQGKTQEKWHIAKLKRGGNRKPVQADVKRSLAAQFRTGAAAAKPPSSPAPVRRPAETGQRPIPMPPVAADADPHAPPF